MRAARVVCKMDSGTSEVSAGGGGGGGLGVPSGPPQHSRSADPKSSPAAATASRRTGSAASALASHATSPSTHKRLILDSLTVCERRHRQSARPILRNQLLAPLRGHHSPSSRTVPLS